MADKPVCAGGYRYYLAEKLSGYSIMKIPVDNYEREEPTEVEWTDSYAYAHAFLKGMREAIKVEALQ